MKILLILLLIYPGSLLAQSCQKRVMELEQELMVEKKMCDMENKKLVNLSKFRVDYKKRTEMYEKKIKVETAMFNKDKEKLMKKYELTKEEVSEIDFSSL